jgi:hypothetical protein
MKFSFLFLSLFLLNCSSTKNTNIIKLRFIDEYVIPANTIYKNTLVGGLSGIDFHDNQYYVVSDDKKNLRYYNLKIDFNKHKINQVLITNITHLNLNKIYDLESIRVQKNHILITSEGNSDEISTPSILKVDFKGNLFQEISSKNTFKNLTPRHNGTFESLSVNNNYYFTAMELPFKEDGNEPSLKKGKYPIRISKINKKTNELENQYAYMLDKIPRDSKPSGKFLVNGLTELIQVTKNTFLTIERSYASGHKDGGNNVKIYQIDISNASDITKINSLTNTKYTPVKKELMFDFEWIRGKLTKEKVDNIEGITFGPKLENGNKSLIVIADNNFNKFSKQLNQIIIFEVIP